MPLVEQELPTLPEHMSSPLVLIGVRVTRALVLCVCFVDRWLSFNTFSFDHCVVCSSSLYKFWLPLWCLYARLIVLFVYFCIEWCPTFCCCSVLCFLFYLSSYCVLCTQCCQFLWIVHFWLPFRFSLSLVYSWKYKCGTWINKYLYYHRKRGIRW